MSKRERLTWSTLISFIYDIGTLKLSRQIKLFADGCVPFYSINILDMQS